VRLGCLLARPHSVAAFVGECDDDDDDDDGDDVDDHAMRRSTRRADAGRASRRDGGRAGGR